MLDDVEASGDADAYVRGILDRGERIMGFGHRVYRAEDPRARVLRRTARELGSQRVEVAEALEEAALAALREQSPDRVLETNVEFWAAVVLEIADIPPPMYPAMFGCARVAGWSAHIVEQRRTGRLIRPSARYVGAAAHARWPKRDARRGRGARRTRSPTQGAERELAELRAKWDEEVEARGALAGLSASAPSPTARSAQFRFRQKIELLRRGLEDESPACRGSALLSLELLSRDHPGVVNGVRPLLHELVDARRQRGRAAAGDHGAAQRVAAAGHDRDPRLRSASDDEQGRELRETAAKIAQVLRRKAGPRVSGRRRRPQPPRASARRRRRDGVPQCVARFVSISPVPMSRSDVPLRRVAAAPLRMRVRLEVRLPPAAIGYVRVELGRPEVGVAEHLLHAAQVGAALEQVGREGVAEEVRMDAIRVEPGDGCEPAQDQEGAGARQRAAASRSGRPRCGDAGRDAGGRAPGSGGAPRPPGGRSGRSVPCRPCR